MLKICLILLESNMIFAKIADFNLTYFGEMMRFLLVNENSAVKKIFNITAKKAGIELDIVENISDIPLDKDYGCIFVDDEVLKTGNVGDFKSKMITTKFCIILSKNSPLIGGFDSYIRKPFLPTDIYDVLKKEKYNEMNNAVDEGESGEDLGEVSEATSDINANSDIDLDEFSDSEDEFLSGAKEADEAQNIDFGGNPMGKSEDLGAESSIETTESIESSVSEMPESSVEPIESTQESIQSTQDLGADLGLDSSVDSVSSDLAQDTIQDAIPMNSSDVDLSIDSVDLDAEGLGANPNMTDSSAVDSNADLAQDTAPIDLGIDSSADSADLSLDSVDSGVNVEEDLVKKPEKKSAKDAPKDKDLSKDSAKDYPKETTKTPAKDSELAEDLVKKPAKDSAEKPKSAPVTVPSNPNADEIDFSQIMAMQEEILREEEAKKAEEERKKAEEEEKSARESNVRKSKRNKAKTDKAEAKDSPKDADSADSSADSNIKDSAPQEAMQDAQGAESDFLETLDFLKEPEPSAEAQSADSNFIDMSNMSSPSAPLPDLTKQDFAPPKADLQDFAQSAAQDFAQSSADSPKYEEYSFDGMANEEIGSELDDLAAISDIKANAPKPKPKNKDAKDILNNLEINPQDNIDTDYHADSIDIVGAAQSANATTADEQSNNFNAAFSSGISAEMDSISPNFKSQDFIQDLTLGSDTTLPDFSKSLKQHTTPEQRYNMLGLPINDDGNIKDIKDLSKNELENLDDEAILLLQEKSLQEPKKPQKSPESQTDSPKVLDKQQIDDITNILKDTQKSKKPSPKPSVSINNNEFSSLTQEALSEVLGEEAEAESLEFKSSDDFIDGVGAKPSQPTAPKVATNKKDTTLPNQINMADSNVDVVGLIQAFPTDKLRDLLSGVQITVNITFPTKKQN